MNTPPPLIDLSLNRMVPHNLDGFCSWYSANISLGETEAMQRIRADEAEKLDQRKHGDWIFEVEASERALIRLFRTSYM